MTIGKALKPTAGKLFSTIAITAIAIFFAMAMPPLLGTRYLEYFFVRLLMYILYWPIGLLPVNFIVSPTGLCLILFVYYYLVTAVCVYLKNVIFKVE